MTVKTNLRTKILDFRGFDSSRILILRGGILTSIGVKIPVSVKNKSFYANPDPAIKQQRLLSNP